MVVDGAAVVVVVGDGGSVAVVVDSGVVVGSVSQINKMLMTWMQQKV